MFLSTFEGDGYLTTKDWVKVVLAGADISGVKSNFNDENQWIYPNPHNTGSLMLTEVGDLFIYNIQGKLLVHSKNEMVIDISQLKTGIYLLKDTKGRKQKLQVK